MVIHMRAHAGPCGTILATVFDSDLRSMDTLRSSRTPSCDFASQSSSRCSSGDLTTLSQVYLALTQPDDFVAGASPLRPKASHYPTATLFAIMYLCLYLGLHPRPPMPKAYIKTQKFYGILGGILPEGNFRNPSVSGELQASRLP